MLKPTPSSNGTTINYQPAHVRCQSADTVQRPRIPASQLLPKRLSCQTVQASLPVLPSTPAEWKQAIAAIKEQHVSKRYRACSARCAEILNNLNDESRVEPAYLIYLHFYAAASMEMCTRPLPLTSPYRASILQQARTHYDRASALIQAAEEAVATRTRSCSVSSSRSSSLHSPASSISSRTWTADSATTSIPSSPTTSVCSFEEFRTKSALASPRRPGVPKRVKKVSFSLPPGSKYAEEEETEPDHRMASFRFPEPIVRPDSPTLGFDEEYFKAGVAMCEPPETPTVKVAESALVIGTTPYEKDLPLVPEEDHLTALAEDDNEVIVRVERSVHRYNETLTDLRQQLNIHTVNVETQLAMTPLASGRPSTPTSPGLLCSPGSPKMPVSPLRFSPSPGSSSPVSDARTLDKQERIERLRKNGWRRKRFDPSRYEELAREVLAELE